MKKLSDYKGEEAIELWGDLLEPLSIILEDNKVRKAISSGKSRLVIAKEILKSHKKEAIEILTRIDPDPVDGLNIVLRLIAVLADIGQSEEIKTFFGYAGQDQTEGESIGSPTENIKVVKK